MKLYTNAHYSTLLEYINSDTKSMALTKKIISDVLKGLVELKSISVIHTDMKPENIVFDMSGKAILVDFGNAALIRDRGVIQTRPYRSPESILGLEFDCSTDVWSLGCIVYEVLSGSYLFQQVSREGKDYGRWKKRKGSQQR